MTDKRKEALEALDISVKFMDARGWSHEERPGVEKVKATLAALTAEQGPEVVTVEKLWDEFMKGDNSEYYGIIYAAILTNLARDFPHGLKIIAATQEGK